MHSHGIVLNQPPLHFNSSVVVFSLYCTKRNIFTIVLPSHPCLLLPVMNTYLLDYPISTHVFIPLLSFYALKELTVKRHKVNILTCIKYLCYHNSYYLTCHFVTFVMAKPCINTYLKQASNFLLSSPIP